MVASEYFRRKKANKKLRRYLSFVFPLVVSLQRQKQQKKSASFFFTDEAGFFFLKPW